MPKRWFVYEGEACVSAGVIFYRVRNKKVDLLLQRRRDKKGKWWYEDLGGKSGAGDRDIIDVAAREAAEESNGAFIKNCLPNADEKQLIEVCQRYIRKLIRLNSYAVVHRASKYLVFLVHLPDKQQFDFGEYEHHPKYNIRRDIEWMSKEEIKNIPIKSIHPRMRHLECFK